MARDLRVKSGAGLTAARIIDDFSLRTKKYPASHLSLFVSAMPADGAAGAVPKTQLNPSMAAELVDGCAASKNFTANEKYMRCICVCLFLRCPLLEQHLNII
jgi:hypothetical protein